MPEIPIAFIWSSFSFPFWYGLHSKNILQPLPDTFPILTSSPQHSSNTFSKLVSHFCPLELILLVFHPDASSSTMLRCCGSKHNEHILVQFSYRFPFLDFLRPLVFLLPHWLLLSFPGWMLLVFWISRRGSRCTVRVRPLNVLPYISRSVCASRLRAFSRRREPWHARNLQSFN